jgi:hypothetical protein
VEATLRHIDYHTTETILFTFSFVMLTLAKITHEARFSNFVTLFISDKYLNIYGKDSRLTITWFNFFLFTVQVIVFGILLKITLEVLKISFNPPLPVLITLLALFILFKFYLEKFIANILELEVFSEQYNFHKLTYRNYIAIALLPLTAITVYAPFYNKVFFYITLSLFIFFNLTSFVLTIKNHQKLILPRVFYFILYLCTLEIAPYLFIYKWVYY